MPEHPGGDHGGGDTDRDVYEEDPVPADRLGQDPAGQQADRAPGGGDEAVDPDRLRLFLRLREHGHDHAEDHGRSHRATDPLEKPGADQHFLALGDPAEQRRGDEYNQTGGEETLASEQVTEPAGEKQQPPERNQVRVHDPGKVGLGETEVVLDRGQGDVHDRRVEDDHQHPEAERIERVPAGLFVCNC